MAQRIEVSQFTTPTPGFQLVDFRNLADPAAIVDITGFTIKLAVKRKASDPESYELFDLAADLDGDPTTGKYSFAFTLAHTCFAPGTYAGEIRWWGNGVDPATNRPLDRIPVDFIVLEAVDRTL